MHELSICQALIRQLEDIAREQSAASITRVAVGIGPLSGVEPALVQSAYPVAAAGSVAENSVLAVENCPIRVHCTQCGKDSDATANRLLCGYCGDWRAELLSGDELLLLQVEFTREAVHV